MDLGVAAVGASPGMTGALARIAAIQAQFATQTGSVGAAVQTRPSTAPGATTAASAPFAAALATAVSAASGVEAGNPAIGTALGQPTAIGAASATDPWILPVAGRVTSPFGMRRHPVTGVYKLHSGTDFAAATGTPIGAASAGVVRSVGWQPGNGNTVVIDHGDGVSTLYGHASTLLVKPGQRVSAGEEIAKVGQTGLATGPHLHLEVRNNDRPVDPLPWLRQRAATS